MTATNHAVTGALIAIAIDKPILALPAAFLSHFAADLLPHWDYYRATEHSFGKLTAAAMDFGLAVCLLFAIFLTITDPFWLVFAGGLLAILPDFMWLPFILKGKTSFGSKKNSVINRFRKFHLSIQWCELKNVYGLAAEAVWLAVMLILIYRIG